MKLVRISSNVIAALFLTFSLGACVTSGGKCGCHKKEMCQKDDKCKGKAGKMCGHKKAEMGGGTCSMEKNTQSEQKKSDDLAN